MTRSVLCFTAMTARYGTLYPIEIYFEGGLVHAVIRNSGVDIYAGYSETLEGALAGVLRSVHDLELELEAEARVRT